MVMIMKYYNRFGRGFTRQCLLAVLALTLWSLAFNTQAAMLYKDYVVRYDRGWDILCDPYQVKQGDWVLKIFRQKGEIANDDFREFLGIFQRLNPHVKDINRIRPGQVVDIPLKKLAQGNLPGQSSGVVTIPFVMISNPKEMIEKHAQTYTIKKGDTVSTLIANQFGGRYGNTTYSQGLELFKAVNPHIKDINRIYAGQKIYMPDPSIREQSWYSSLFDEAGGLVERMTDSAASASDASPPQPTTPAASGPISPVADPATTSPVADAASAIGGRLLDKGTYFFPMQEEKDFELDLSRYPMIDLQNGAKVILTREDRVMNVDLALLRSYWDDVNVVKVPDEATSQDILQAVLSSMTVDASSNQLAFDDEGITIRVSAKWIRSEPSPDGRVPRHTCITPINFPSQRTHDAVVRYLDQNDIIIKEVLAGASGAEPSAPLMGDTPDVTSIDGSDQKTLIASFARLMGFNYSANTSISFPYAGIQVQALSNLLSFGNGKEILIDFGDLYGDAIDAISSTGLQIMKIHVDAKPVEIIQQLMETAGMAYTSAPVFYGASRAAEFNTAITVRGILIPTSGGENRLFAEMQIPELIARFIRDQGIQLVRIRNGAQG